MARGPGAWKWGTLHALPPRSGPAPLARRSPRTLTVHPPSRALCHPIRDWRPSGFSRYGPYGYAH
eukprot:7265367-Prymnesium_polylepis.1